MKLKKKLRALKNISKVRMFNQKVPMWLNVELTNRCNFKCKYCNQDRKEDLDNELLYSLIEEIKDDLLIINLFGGEPLLRDDLKDIITYLQKKDGIFVSMNTNGYLLEEKIEDVADVDYLLVSLDGGEEIQNKMRRKDSFQKIIRGIKLAKERGIIVGINVTLTKQCMPDIQFLLNLTKELDVIFQFHRAKPCVLGNDFDKSLLLSDLEYVKFIDFLLSNYDMYNIGYSKKILNEEKIKKGKYSECPVKNIFFYLEANGTIRGCSHPDILINSFSLKDTSFNSIFNNLKNPVCDVCLPCFTQPKDYLLLNPSAFINMIKKFL